MSNSTEKIKCPAIRRDDGEVLTGTSHGSIVANNAMMGGPRLHEKDEGFLTSDDRFVDRQEASKIAFSAGQIDKDNGSLFSWQLKER